MHRNPLIFFSLPLLLWATTERTVSAEPSRPNIVFIMADDLGYGDLGCYGQRLIKTPHIDQLAAEGLRFTQAYSGGPVCTSARAVLMTGLHNGHTIARDNVPHYRTYLQEDDVTVAEVLQSAGYRSGGVGKWSLGDAGTVGRATNQGFDTWLGYLNQDHAHFYYTKYLDDDEGRLELPDNPTSRQHYSHDLFTDRALKFIKESKNEPFFLYAAYTVPHFASGKEDKDRLAVPSTAPYSQKPWDERSKKYAAMIHRLDRDVGRIIETIQELGKSDNTLIIFTSDHGGHDSVHERFNTSGPLRGYKRHLTEGGLRVPFIAKWPTVVPAGQVSEAVISFQDMMPTFAELAGVQAPTDTDGISVVSALRGQPLTQKRDYLYWDFGHCRSRYDQAVRLNNWKGIRLGQGGPIQLYDLNSDIHEDDNIADQHPGIVARINAIMTSAVTPNPRYTVGKLYTGKAIWKRNGRK